MSKSTKGLRNAGLASLAITLTLGAGFLGAGAASADADFEFTRIDGENRYDTAALVAAEYVTDTTDEVILVNGEAGYYADALTANYLSGNRNAPILLTRDEFMPQPTKDALENLDPATITIVGGTGVVPQEQEDALEAEGYTVNRVAGDNRFLTNVEVIETAGTTTEDTGIVATGFDFADALGAGPAVYQDRPLGLSKQDDINDDIVQALKDSGVTKIVVLGGEAVVGQEVVDELEDANFTVTRVDGADRSETSTEFADYAIKNFGFTNTAADVASGYTLGSGADALAGGPLTGERNRPMLITKNVDNPGALIGWLEDNAATLTEGVIYGGFGAVTASAEDRMEAAARSVTTNQDYTVNGQESATNTVSTDDGSSTDNRGLRQYSVSGLAAGDYDLRLFPAENVTVDENGVVSFVDDDGTAGAGNNEADTDDAAGDDVLAVIEVVNGSAQTTDVSLVEDVEPVNGTINFSIDSVDAEQVIPVVFTDEEDDNTLELDANNQPTEAFGIGGQKSWVPEEEGNGPVGGNLTTNEVVSTNEAADEFVTNAAFYEYDANDVFYVGDAGEGEAAGNRVTLAEFEEELSVGDALDANSEYFQNEAFSSTFILVDQAPEAPATVTTERQTDGRTVELTFDESDTTTVDSYTVYRAQLTNTEQDANSDPLIADVDCGDLADTRFTSIGSVADNNPAGDEFTFTDDSTEFGESYCYAVVAVDDGEESSRTPGDAMVTTLSEAPETAAPTLVDTDLTDQGTPVTLDAGDDADVDVDGNAATLETTGDKVTIQFSEAMDTAALSDGDVIRITDAEGEVFQVVVSATADTARNGEVLVDWNDYDPAGSAPVITNGELVLTLVDNPVKVGGATPAGAGAGTAQVPADITAFTANALQDLAGNDADLAGSADRTIDNEL